MVKYLQLIIAVLLISAFTTKAQTNVYHPFPDSAQWNYVASNWCPTGFGSNLTWISFKMNSDSVINSVSYKKVATTGFLRFVPGNCWSLQSGTNDTTYFVHAPELHLIREDTNQKRIYQYNTSTGIDELLYDFDLNTGDTVPGILAPVSPIPFPDTVISIDSVLIGNLYHKRFKVNNMYDIYWIEGIGSTYGLFVQSPGMIWDMADILLTCHKSNGIIDYTLPANSCDLITSVNSINNNNNNVEVYPNPANDFIGCSWSDNIIATFLSVQSLTGKTIFRKDIDKDQHQQVVDIGKLEAGVYFLILNNELKRQVIKKFVKTNH